MSAPRWPWLLAPLVLACASRTPAQRPGAPTPFGELAQEPQPGAWFQRDAARARAAGAGDTVILAVEAATQGDAVSAMLSVPADSCALVLARAGAEVADLDLMVVGEDGRLLGMDLAPDATPSVMVCPPHPERLFVSARVAEGLGLVALGAQRVPPSAANALMARLGIAPHGSPLDDEAGRLEPLERRRRSLGPEWSTVYLTKIPLSAGRSSHFDVDVTGPRCAEIAGYVEPLAQPTELLLRDEAGRIITTQTWTEAITVSTLCAAATTRISAELRSLRGQGWAVVNVNRSLEGAASRLATHRDVVFIGPGPAFDATLQQLEARLSRAGLEQRQRLPLSVGAGGRSSSAQLELRAGCARLDVVARSTTLGVETKLWRLPEEQLVARARGPGHTTSYSCGAARTEQLELRAVSPLEHALVVVSQERQAPPALLAAPLAASRALDALLGVVELGSLDELSSARALTLSDATRAVLPELELEPRRCAAFGVGAEPGVQGVELRLLHASSGAELAYAMGDQAVALRYCAEQERVRVQPRVEVGVGAGAGVYVHALAR